jgi:hypothetical protein
VEPVGIIAAAIALLSAAVIGVSLWRGTVPARWPFPSLERRTTPTAFWAMIVLYGVAAIVSAFAAQRFTG